MVNNFLLLSLILGVLLIGLDAALFSLRKRFYIHGIPFLLLVKDKLGKVRSWLGKRWAKFSKPRSRVRGSGQPPGDGEVHPASQGGLSAGSIQATGPEKGSLAKQGESGQILGSPPIPDAATSQYNTEGRLPDQRIAAQPASMHKKKAVITRKVASEDLVLKNESTAGGQKMAHVQISADIPEDTTIHITLEVVDGQGRAIISKTVPSREGDQNLPAEQLRPGSELQALQVANQARLNQPARSAWPKRFFMDLKRFLSKARQAGSSLAININYRLKNQQQVLLLAAVAVYALVVSIGIDRFPIYFFTDEAIHMNLASDFIRDGLKNYDGEFLPTFFTLEGWVNGTSVYVQVVPYLIFGKSIIATRLVSAFITLLGALALGLLLKDVFKLKYYWVGILLLLTTPAWFLHARTAFEYVEVGSFYSIFLYFYSRYRLGHLRSLYWAIIAGALCFYTHGLGQILMGITGLALAIIDFPYHIHPDRRKTVLFAALLIVILFLPFVRYYVAHPTEVADQVKRRGSYWSDVGLTFVHKVGQFFSQYLYGLSPSYWYFPNNVDLSRHVMDGYGNGFWFTLPFLAAGLYQAIRNIRLPAYRIVLVALLACPVPASVVAIGMPRMVWMAIPLAILTAIGLLAILQWVESHWHISSAWIPAGLFVVMAGLSGFMLRDALVNGPTWFKDYSLYGMQYGAKQVFQDLVLPGLEQDPNRRYVVSPSWANGTEQFVSFFIPPPLQSRVSMGQPIDFIDVIKSGAPDYYFVATVDEYNKLVVNNEFKDIKVEQIIPYPDGTPGFYVITLKVADNIDQIIDAQKEANRTPVEDSVVFMGQTIRVLHSPLGSGRLEDIFDNDPDTLARVLEANPAIFDLYLTTPIDTHSIVVQTGSLPSFSLTVSLYAPDATTPVTYSQTFTNNPPDPLVTMNFDQGPGQSVRVDVEIKDNNSGDSAQIHVRTIQFK